MLFAARIQGNFSLRAASAYWVDGPPNRCWKGSCRVPSQSSGLQLRTSERGERLDVGKKPLLLASAAGMAYQGAAWAETRFDR